jgi:hypothetical protein
MTISVGRLLACVSALVVIVGIVVFAWSWLAKGGSKTFVGRAEAICRQELPAIAHAPDLQAALVQSREMRLRLSALTPPSLQKQLFSDWMAGLLAAEIDGARGDFSAALATDARVESEVRELGLADGCVYTLR